MKHSIPFTDAQDRAWLVVDYRYIAGKKKAVPIGSSTADGRAFSPDGHEHSVMLHPYDAIPIRDTDRKTLQGQLDSARSIDAPASAAWGATIMQPTARPTATFGPHTPVFCSIPSSAANAIGLWSCARYRHAPTDGETWYGLEGHHARAEFVFHCRVALVSILVLFLRALSRKRAGTRHQLRVFEFVVHGYSRWHERSEMRRAAA